MIYSIDTTTYNKARDKAVGNGWDRRPKNKRPTSIVIHSTNGNRGSTLAGEASFIYSSPYISAHYLTPKTSEYSIVEFLDPALRAWHTGSALEGYFNSDSIGIETHFTPGETWHQEGTAILTWLVRRLMGIYLIPLVKVESHRTIALPAGRKKDPSQFSTDPLFYAWRDALIVPPVDRAVIGVQPSITLAQFKAVLTRHSAQVTPGEAERVYLMCSWLEIDPCFVIALWKAEAGSPLGSSVLQQQSRMPINKKTFKWPERLSVSYNGAEWEAWQSFQLGLFASLLHLKQVHGANGRTTVRQIIPVHAPKTDNNDPERIIASVLQDMQYMQTH